MYRRLNGLLHPGYPPSIDEEQAMSQYRTFTAADAVEYARQFGGVDNPAALSSAEEIVTRRNSACA